jgi:diacylglycerol kinase family enzyme
MPRAGRFRHAALIYNPAAGFWKGFRRRQLDRALDYLDACAIRCDRLATTGTNHATELARAAAAAGRDLVIACGGDGTVNEVANGLAGTDTPMAIFPAGTGNAAATVLGIPWNLWRAAEYIPRGVVRRIALGRARKPGEPDGRYFFSLAGAGMDGHLFERVNRMGPMGFKFARVTLEGYRELWLYDFPLFEVHVNDEVLPAAQVALGRLNYALLPITPRADLFRDDFEAVVVSTRSRLKFFLYSFAVLTRCLHWLPGVHCRLAQHARALPPPGRRILVETDAENAGELPMEFEVVPQALALLVPEKLAPATSGQAERWKI